MVVFSGIYSSGVSGDKIWGVLGNPAHHWVPALLSCSHLFMHRNGFQLTSDSVLPAGWFLCTQVIAGRITRQLVEFQLFLQLFAGEGGFAVFCSCPWTTWQHQTAHVLFWPQIVSLLSQLPPSASPSSTCPRLLFLLGCKRGKCLVPLPCACSLLGTVCSSVCQLLQ